MWIFLTLALCMILSACGKGEAVKNTEAQNTIPAEVTQESDGALNADATLTEEEQGQVEESETQATADIFQPQELKFVGEWCSNYIDYWSLEENTADCILILNADGTAIHYGGQGTWSVSENKVVTSWGELNIHEENGRIALNWVDNPNEGDRLIPRQEYQYILDNYFLIVDLAETDPSEICEIYIEEFEELNERGKPNGTKNTCVMLGSKLYDQGWYNYQGHDNFSIEIKIPAFVRQWHRAGNSGTEVIDSDVIVAHGFGYGLAYLACNDTTGSVRETPNLTVDQISFGKAEGKMYFINKDYVKQVTRENRHYRILETYNSLIPEISVPSLLECWSEEHPF